MSPSACQRPRSRLRPIVVLSLQATASLSAPVALALEENTLSLFLPCQQAQRTCVSLASARPSSGAIWDYFLWLSLSSMTQSYVLGTSQEYQVWWHWQVIVSASQVVTPEKDGDAVNTHPWASPECLRSPFLGLELRLEARQFSIMFWLQIVQDGGSCFPNQDLLSKMCNTWCRILSLTLLKPTWLLPKNSDSRNWKTRSKPMFCPNLERTVKFSELWFPHFRSNDYTSRSSPAVGLGIKVSCAEHSCPCLV